MSRGDGWRIVIIGAGGVIGSHLVPHTVRDPRVETIVLIDVDDYEAANLECQDIPPDAVGRPKAVVQAERARRTRPGIEVVAIPADVEDLPPGSLHGDIVLTCLDSRRSRQHVNLVTRRLGIPWIDAGVLGSQLLVRVEAFLPGADAPCLECRWSEADYAALEQRYPCASVQRATAPTGAPSSLGALAAAVQSIECSKLLAGDAEALAAGEQIVIDAARRAMWRTTHRLNDACRAGDHLPWTIRTLGGGLEQLTLRAVFARARSLLEGADTTDDGSIELFVDPLRFIRRLVCESCGAVHRDLRIATRRVPPPCQECGGVVNALGLYLTESIAESRLDDEELDTALGALSFEPGDILTVGLGEVEVHFELADAVDHEENVKKGDECHVA